MTGFVRVAKPRRQHTVTCAEGCDLGPRKDASWISRHVRETGHAVTVTQTRSFRVLLEVTT